MGRGFESRLRLSVLRVAGGACPVRTHSDEVVGATHASPANPRTRSLVENLAALLVNQDLALHALEGVVDRLRVASELLRHLFVGTPFQVEPKRFALERR